MSTPLSFEISTSRRTTTSSSSMRPEHRGTRATGTVRDDSAARAVSIRCCGGRSPSSKSFGMPAAQPTRDFDFQQARGRRHLTAVASRGRSVGFRCLGPLGRPFTPIDPPAEAWMIAGGVGLAPFLTLAEALASRKTPTNALLRRAQRGRALLRRSVRALGVADDPGHRRRKSRRPRVG